MGYTFQPIFLQSTQQRNQVEEEDSHLDCSEMNLHHQHEDSYSTSDTFQQLHSAVGDPQETQSEKIDLSNELKSWTAEGNISHVAVKMLAFECEETSVSLKLAIRSSYSSWYTPMHF